MALTGLTGIQITNLNVSGIATFEQTVGIAGTLTYEDVTNVDSVGLVTARDGIKVSGGQVLVGSGTSLHSTGLDLGTGNITGHNLKSTGIITATTFTGNGASLTNLNASNIATGTVPTARLGSGTANNTTFLRGDSTFQTVNTDLVSDTSPQLGGNLDTNSHNIYLDDDHKVIFGNDQSADLHIFHESSSGTGNIYNATGQLRIRTNDLRLKNLGNSETYLKAVINGAVELYHNNEKKLYTYGEGVFVQDDSSAGAYLVLATNAGTQGSLYGTANTLGFLDGQNHYMLKGVKDGAVELYNDNTKRLETTSTGAKVTGNLQFASAGQGIDFSASAHSSGQQSELLDDYERGNWTPQFFNARTGGTQLTNPSNTQAHYVKVGRIVYLHLGVHGLTKNWAGSNTQIFIRGLPYRSYFQHNGHCIRCGYFGPTGVTYSTFANLRQYDTYMELQKSGGAQGRYDALYWSDIHWEGYGNVTCEMVYETDQGV